MRILISIWGLFVCLFLCSCSLKIPHQDGSATYLGMVTVNEPADEGAPIRHTRRYGLAVDAGLRDAGVLVGYQDELKVVPPAERVTQFDYQFRRRSYRGEFVSEPEKTR